MRNTEKTKDVLPEVVDVVRGEQAITDNQQAPKPGHGRNAAYAFSGAQKIAIPHANLKSGDGCPECEKGKVYVQKEPKPLVRIIGQGPLAATVYELERLRLAARCSRPKNRRKWGRTSTTKQPAPLIAQLKYGSGVPFYRLEKLQSSLGIPLPAATQARRCALPAQLRNRHAGSFPW